MLGSRPISFILVLAAALAAMPAIAQTVGKPNAGAKVPDKAVAANKAFEAGQKAFEAGKTDAAVTALSTAIGSGGLANAQLAKALFYRGVAYRGQKKPGIALSDLNAAVWLRDGLSATDKAVADDHRQALLREVAAANGTPIAPVTTAAITQAPTAAPLAAVTSPSTVEQPAATPLPEPAGSLQPVAVAPPSEQPAALPWTTATASVQPPTSPAATDLQPAAAHDTIAEPVASIAPVDRATIATVQAEPAPPSKPLPWQMAEAKAAAPPPEQPSPWTAPAVTATAAPQEALHTPAAAIEPNKAAASDTLQQPEPVAALSATPVDALPALPSAIANAPSALADAGKAAGSALASLFSGSLASPPAADAPLGVVAVAEPPPAVTPIETASVNKEPAVAARATDEPPAAVWSSQTTAPVVPASAPVKIAAAEAAPAADAVPSTTILPGPYRLQIAAENSREAADQILSRLISQHGQSLRGLQPVVEEPQTVGVLFGSMSAAYRVSIGPYANKLEPGRLCNILKPHEFDCRVVAVAP